MFYLNFINKLKNYFLLINKLSDSIQLIYKKI